jgi:hypothetical protein
MKHFQREFWAALAGICIIGLLLGLAWLQQEPSTRSSWDWVYPVLFSLVVLAVAVLMRPRQVNRNHWKMPLVPILLLTTGIGSTIVYAITLNTLAAWGLVIFFFAFLLIIDEVFSTVLINPSNSGRKGVRNVGFILGRWFLHILMALLCGGVIVLIGEIESHFADEEFFTAIQGVLLGVYWLALRAVFVFILRQIKNPLAANRDANQEKHASRSSLSLGLDGRWLVPLCITAVFGFSLWAIRDYQTSFYPTEAPTFSGISAESPFLCGQVLPAAQTYSGEDEFRRLLVLVEANPSKGPPEYGMLALGTRSENWAAVFHDSLLAEARDKLFTGSAGSVKSVQYDAALRAYYYFKVHSAFSNLFTAAEEGTIQGWFAAINRRALAVEPVDLLYALAFSKWPQGPYENQENGAGLLAILETAGLADPTLSSRNQAYLSANPGGWLLRFRVTDDAAVYQPEWLDNAYFQSLYTQKTLQANLANSFEWLLLQALPDGSPLKYNHVGQVSMSGVGFWGAELTGDGRYLWAAGRSIDYLESHGGFAKAQPGLDGPVDLQGLSPTDGSCLLYGDSGLPNQVGPLAPDKIVLRDGWQADSTYLLLNLRFSGWHRYKATNTVTILYKDGPLIVENTEAKSFGWLPAGRSLFRDKRIPRENLNGLVVARTGLSAVLYDLTWIGGPWSQDPPYYAQVLSFDPATSTSSTKISGWRGWMQVRTISLNQDSLTVTDTANGPKDQSGAIIWHFAPGASLSGNRILLGSVDHLTEAIITIPAGESIRSVPEESGLRVEIHGRGQVRAEIDFHFYDQMMGED